jgi:hypothetical protein
VSPVLLYVTITGKAVHHASGPSGLGLIRDDVQLLVDQRLAVEPGRRLADRNQLA